MGLDREVMRKIQENENIASSLKAAIADAKKMEGRAKMAEYRLEVLKLILSIGCNPEAAARQAVEVSNILWSANDE